MAKVKDRLIFETKKMEAFEQRKSNKEQRLRAKEARANKAIEKAKAKKDHLKAVDDWAKDAASNRIPGAIRDDDDYQLSRLGGPNKKRQRADSKYGYGGKRGRFKQNDAKTLNDMSGYNPRGNFGGMGTKSGKHKSGGGAGGGGGGGAKRKGKRARDAARSRR
jgi:rRNA-processing protein EBP2